MKLRIALLALVAAAGVLASMAVAKPPPGHGLHHYHFQVFALNRPLSLRAPIDRDQLVEAMRDHVLAWGELVGTYQR